MLKNTTPTRHGTVEVKVHSSLTSTQDLHLVTFMFQLLNPWGKSPQYAMDRRRLGESLSQSAVVAKRKIPTPAGNETAVVHLCPSS
jgi:hypothetical protein